jgi:hypothetical protein
VSRDGLCLLWSGRRRAKRARRRPTPIGRRVTRPPEKLAAAVGQSPLLNPIPNVVQVVLLTGRQFFVDFIPQPDEQAGKIGLNDAHHVGHVSLAFADDAADFPPLFGPEVELVDRALELVETRHRPAGLWRRRGGMDLPYEQPASHDARGEDDDRRQHRQDDMRRFH